jgi:hypothetical protein
MVSEWVVDGKQECFLMGDGVMLCFGGMMLKGRVSCGNEENFLCVFYLHLSFPPMWFEL